MSLIESARENFDSGLKAEHPTMCVLQFEMHGKVVDLLWSNSLYGSYLFQALIDGSFESPVDDKYRVGKKTKLSACSSRLGAREFEKGCVLYEFVIKPFGLPFKEGHLGFILCSRYEVENYLTEQGIKFISYNY